MTGRRAAASRAPARALRLPALLCVALSRERRRKSDARIKREGQAAATQADAHPHTPPTQRNGPGGKKHTEMVRGGRQRTRGPRKRSGLSAHVCSFIPRMIRSVRAAAVPKHGRGRRCVRDERRPARLGAGQSVDPKTAVRLIRADPYSSCRRTRTTLDQNGELCGQEARSARLYQQGPKRNHSSCRCVVTGG